MDLAGICELGKELGYSGEGLQQFVKEQRELDSSREKDRLERDERERVRELKKLELEDKKRESTLALERLRLEYEDKDKEKTLALEKLRLDLERERVSLELEKAKLGKVVKSEEGISLWVFLRCLRCRPLMTRRTTSTLIYKGLSVLLRHSLGQRENGQHISALY